jgi:hypothetical protein
MNSYVRIEKAQKQSLNENERGIGEQEYLAVPLTKCFSKVSYINYIIRNGMKEIKRKTITKTISFWIPEALFYREQTFQYSGKNYCTELVKCVMHICRGWD